jgi:hypothetical protein
LRALGDALFVNRHGSPTPPANSPYNTSMGALTLRASAAKSSLMKERL